MPRKKQKQASEDEKNTIICLELRVHVISGHFSFALTTIMHYINFLKLCAVVFTMRRISLSAHIALLLLVELHCMTRNHVNVMCKKIKTLVIVRAMWENTALVQ